MNYRENTDIFNFKLLKDVRLTKHGIPIIKGTDYYPKQFISFNYVLSTKNRNDFGVHFYIDDYQFERIWNNPTKYTKILKQFNCLIGPDFSMYKNFPKPLQIFNLYKQRLLMAYWQNQGLKVIPNICWSSLDDLDFCLEGLPKYSIVALSTNGCLNKKVKIEFVQCFEKMVDILKPLKIIIIGSIPKELNKYKNIILQFNSHINHFEKLKKGVKI